MSRLTTCDTSLDCIDYTHGSRSDIDLVDINMEVGG